MPLLSEPDLARARERARPLLDRLDLASYRPHFWDGSFAELPVLHLDDFSAIPFLVDIDGVEEYQHRARLRAGNGDLFAASTPQDAVYEGYCRERLRLGRSEFLSAAADGDPLEVATACQAGSVFRRLVERAREAGALAIHPYMGIEPVWELARAVASASGRGVAVLAPPPPVTWVANDKAAFADLVARVVGTSYLVETLVGSSSAELARHLAELAGRHKRVALKRLRCASAMGNAVFDAADLAGEDPAAVEGRVRDFLERTEWDGAEEVLTVAWEDTDVSPSTQLWIPPAGTGPPRLDGVYVQILEGARRVFVGSRPSTLPAAVDRELAAVSLEVAAGLQELGYVGRCSFDFLVVGDPAGDFAVRFVECNGRWGGTSTPMALLDRLLEQAPAKPSGGEADAARWSRAGSRPPYRAQDFVHPGLVGAGVSDVLAAVGDELFDPATGNGRFVFYNVGPLERFGKLDVIALGQTQAEAEAALDEDLPRLLGLG